MVDLIGCSAKIIRNNRNCIIDKNFGKIGFILKHFCYEDDYLIEFKNDFGYYRFHEFEILSLDNNNNFEPVGNGQRKLCYWCWSKLKHISYSFGKTLYFDTSYCPKCLR